LVGVGVTASDMGKVVAASDALLDVDRLAARLGVTVRFVRRLVEERRIPYLKIGRLVRFDPVEVERWINTTRVDPEQQRAHVGWSRLR